MAKRNLLLLAGAGAISVTVAGLLATHGLGDRSLRGRFRELNLGMRYERVLQHMARPGFRNGWEIPGFHDEWGGVPPLFCKRWRGDGVEIWLFFEQGTPDSPRNAVLSGGTMWDEDSGRKEELGQGRDAIQGWIRRLLP